MPNLKNIQTEVDASYLYQKLAENEENKEVADIFRQMCEIEKGHAMAFLQKVNLSADKLPRPSFRARTLNRIGKIFGYDYVLGVLMDTEKTLSGSIINTKKNTSSQSQVLKKIMLQFCKILWANQRSQEAPLLALKPVIAL